MRYYAVVIILSKNSATNYEGLSRKKKERERIIYVLKIYIKKGVHKEEDMID